MGRINGFSVSQQYTDAINKIFNALPTNTKSRFICQAIVEKAQRTKNLNRFGYVSFEDENDIGEDVKEKEETVEEIIEETPKVEESESDKLLKLLTTDELEVHAEEIRPFKDKPNILEAIVSDIIKKRNSGQKENNKKEKEEAKLRDDALAKLNSY